ncbi:hypothetical protein L9F63_021366, partial [Diploptera punctata]
NVKANSRLEYFIKFTSSLNYQPTDATSLLNAATQIHDDASEHRSKTRRNFITFQTVNVLGTTFLRLMLVTYFNGHTSRMFVILFYVYQVIRPFIFDIRHMYGKSDIFYVKSTSYIIQHHAQKPERREGIMKEQEFALLSMFPNTYTKVRGRNNVQLKMLHHC